MRLLVGFLQSLLVIWSSFNHDISRILLVCLFFSCVRYSQEISQNGWQSLRNHLSALHARFYVGLFAAILLVDLFYDRYWACVWDLMYGVAAVWIIYEQYLSYIFSHYSMYVMSFRPLVIIFALYSFWFPQIAYSAYTGARRTLDVHYLLGMSLTRLFFPLYLLGCPSNLFSLITEKNTTYFTACWVLILWMAIQVTIVLLQVRLQHSDVRPYYLLTLC